jgi:HEAT repeat protein
MKVCLAASLVLLGFITLARGGGSGTPKREDVPKYLNMLKNSPSAKERALGAEMLGKRGAIKASDVADAIDPLKTALKKDKEISVRKAAAEALGSIGSDPETVVPLLIDTLKEKNRDLKLGAISALAQYGSDAKDALPALRELANEKTDKMIAKAATGAVKSISGKKK